jgi:hypothetical protein
MIDFGTLHRVGITSVMRWCIFVAGVGVPVLVGASPVSAQLDHIGDPKAPSFEALQSYVNDCRSAIAFQTFSLSDVRAAFRNWDTTLLSPGKGIFNGNFQKPGDPTTSVGVTLTFDAETKTHIVGRCVVKYDARNAASEYQPLAGQFMDKFPSVIQLFLDLSEKAKEIGQSSGGRPYYVTCLGGHAIAHFATAIADNDGFEVHVATLSRSNSVCAS